MDPDRPETKKGEVGLRRPAADKASGSGAGARREDLGRTAAGADEGSGAAGLSAPAAGGLIRP